MVPKTSGAATGEAEVVPAVPQVHLGGHALAAVGLRIVRLPFELGFPRCLGLGLKLVGPLLLPGGALLALLVAGRRVGPPLVSLVAHLEREAAGGNVAAGGVGLG